MSTAASPQSVSSSSTSWSNRHSSLLLEQDEAVALRGAAGGAGLSSNESGFTNPSSFGSLFAMLSNRSPTHAHEAVERSAYEAGASLARLARLETDPDVESMRACDSASSPDWHYRPVTSSSVAPLTLFQTSLPTYACARCGTTLALQDELISKAFSGRDGKAFLFFSVLNARMGQREDRNLLTGLHSVADLSCMTCSRSVGWCYLRAFEASQRYKEGKFILERASLQKTNNWQLGT